MERDVGVGDLLRETLALTSDARRDVVLYVLVIGGLDALGVLLGLSEPAEVGFRFGFVAETSDGATSGLFNLIAGILGVVGGYLLLTRFLAARGRFQDGRTRFWQYLAVGILTLIGIMLGMALLFIPGIVLLCRWSAASGFVVGERKGVGESINASWQATRGHSWAIFLAGLLLFIAILFVFGALGNLADVMDEDVASVVSAFAQAITNAVLPAFWTAIYVHLHEPSGELREVFA